MCGGGYVRLSDTAVGWSNEMMKRNKIKFQNCLINLSKFHLYLYGSHILFPIKPHNLHLCYNPKNDVKNTFCQYKIQDKWRSVESEDRNNQTCDKNDKVQRLSLPDLIDRGISRNSTCPWTCSVLRERRQFKIWTKRFSAEKSSVSQQPCFHGIQQPWTFLYPNTMTNALQASLDWFPTPPLQLFGIFYNTWFVKFKIKAVISKKQNKAILQHCNWHFLKSTFF